MKIELAQPSVIEFYLDHLKRHMAESGSGNSPIFGPYSSKETFDREVRRKTILERWAKPLSEAGWERAWIVTDGDRIVGHLDLRARGLATSLHRAVIGMGLEEAYRGQKIGDALISLAVSWARSQPQIEWIDLNVFAHNQAAIQLYKRCGFVEIGRVNDLFRVDGQMIDDISMTLKLR